MIIFKNKGAIDLRAIKTFGVSVKKEGSIGFFGTGLKYAIAILLREGCSISVYSGGVENKFTVKKVKVTGQDFDVVCMNDEELGFTTELGKTWKLWQAMRELYCNCTDEGGTINKGSDVSCGADQTVITVSGQEFEKIFDDVGSFILQDKPDVETESCDVRKRPNNCLFYKGVRVKDDMDTCIYTYNVKDGITLTEDRTAKYNHEIQRSISGCIVQLEDEEMIERILLANDMSYEGKLYYAYTSKIPSQMFLQTAKRVAESNVKRFNQSAIDYAKKHMEINEEPTPYEPTQLEMKIVKRAQELLMLAGFNVNDFPLHFVDRLGENVLAQAKLGKMYVSKACFGKGTKLIAHALLEEHFHLETGFGDETREFQTFLFDNILTLVERLNQEPF